MRHGLASLVLICAPVALAGEPAPLPGPALAAPAVDTGSAADAASVTLPFELRDGRVFVVARIEDQPLTLLVDTGGINVLAQGAATRLGLRADAALSQGAGTPVVRVAKVELGGHVLRDQNFYSLDLGRLPEIEGAAIDGVLGYETFERSVVTIDYARRVLTLTDPARFVYSGSATRLHFDLDERLPLIVAKLDGLTGEFTVDVGGRGPLTLYGGFVGEHALLDHYPHGHETVVGWGIAGPVQGFPTRIAALELGGVAAPKVVAYLQTGDRRAPGARVIAGRIGGRLLARFSVTLDYLRRELILEPNAALATPDPYDRSGLWLNLDGEDLIIDALQPNGPGARAQLQQHDRIVSLDGVPATQLTLAGVRRTLAESPAGTRIKITARRDSKVVYATVVLADIVPAP